MVCITRGLFNLFSHKTIFKPSVPGANSQLHVRLSDSPAHAGLKAASKLIEDGGDFVRLPMTWLKNIQANWPIYLICGTIICLSILYLYCMIRRYFYRSSTCIV